jgi:hypothetical protein
MKIEVDLPDELVKGLRDRSDARGVTLDAYTTELLYQLLKHEELGEQNRIENRPDWEAALERSRADLAAGRKIAHEEVLGWHRNRS